MDRQIPLIGMKLFSADDFRRLKRGGRGGGASSGTLDNCKKRAHNFRTVPNLFILKVFPTFSFNLSTN